MTRIATPDAAEVETAEPIDSDGESLPYVGRAAICFLEVSRELSLKKIYEEVAQALQDDPRVVSINIPSVKEEDSLFPILMSRFCSDPGKEGAIPDPYTHFHVLGFRSPITMHVRAPRRLQTTFSHFSEIPSEEYWASWDGVSLSVIWTPVAPGKTAETITIGEMLDALSPSGGLVIQQILKEATEKCGHGLCTVQCSPNCDYTFLHANLVLETVGPDKVTCFNDPDETPFINADLAVDHDPYAALEELHAEIQFSARVFAHMRCANDSMIEIAQFAYVNNARLLRLNYERANVGAQEFWSRLKGRWKLRGWKRQARRYMAGINLSLASLEKLRSDWARDKPVFDASAKDENNGAVFEHEYQLSAEAMATIQVSEVRSTVEYLTTSLDTNSLVIATAIGAIAGAIIGALVATFF